MHNGKASAKSTLFRLRNIPIFYLPFVTHPVPEQGADQRQSGFLIPVVGQSSTKGLVLGEQIYFALSRSTDLTVGSEYFSKRGWQTSATFRFKGRNLDFATAHFSNLLDRGFYGTILSQGPNSTIVSSTGYINQGGEDIVVSGRKDFSRTPASPATPSTSANTPTARHSPITSTRPSPPTSSPLSTAPTKPTASSPLSKATAIRD